MSKFFLATLVILSCSIQSHTVEYTVTSNTGDTPSGIRFTNENGIPYSQQIMSKSTNFIWRTFQQNDPSKQKDIAKVNLFIDNMDDESYTSNNEMHVTATYLGGFSGDVNREFMGFLYHEMMHVWQWDGARQAPDGLIEGTADFVRLRSRYVPDHKVQPGQGDRWDHGHDVMARFLDHCNGLRNGFVLELTKKMKTGYRDDYFVDLLGKTVDQLWSEYKAKILYLT